MVLVTFALVLFSPPLSGANLDELINQNVRDATRAYEKTLPPAQQPANPAQLWIHVRSDSQNKLAQEILDRVASTEFRQWKMEQKPVQKVDSGPGKSQLRYFKRQDRTQVRELFDMLRKLIPQLELSDLSGKYESVGWIKSGHFELWLSPDLMRLQSQQ
jgi:hypothetical protein